MGAPQTTVRTDLSSGIPAGLLANDSQIKNCRSTTNAESTAGIAPGAFVKQGSTDDAGNVVGAGTDLLRGIAVFGQAYAPGFETDSSTGAYLPKTVFPVLDNGEVYVYPEESVAPGDAVRVRVSGTGTVGALRKTADAGHSIDISAFASWTKAGSSTVPAIVKLNMHGPMKGTAD